ncbi:hypothetical protein ACH5AO_10685 [Streptomyces sp. NPDC018964]|uniref:hypothetical protein n=1 Tax=Streptomyces sp. NPDC018964 TaxID=3365058 RepID=UPI0037B1A90B
MKFTAEAGVVVAKTATEGHFALRLRLRWTRADTAPARPAGSGNWRAWPPSREQPPWPVGIRREAADGPAHGVGVLCGPRHILTCAHVIGRAGDTPDPPRKPDPSRKATPCPKPAPRSPRNPS